MDTMKRMTLVFLLLSITGVFGLPSSMQSTSHESVPILYKFNATTDILSSLQLSNIYPITQGKGILIAEIDTGISTMFESHIFHNTMEIPNNGKDDDGNGYIDDYRGWNVLADNNNTYDDSITIHGTEVASTILNIAPNATILPIKYISSDNTIADYTDLLKLNDALDYISLFPVDVIVMAFNFNVVTPSTTLSRLQQLQNNGTIILVAAGNCHPSVAGDCGYVQSPANNNYVYAIGSIASDNTHSDFSAEGPQLAFV